MTYCHNFEVQRRFSQSNKPVNVTRRLAEFLFGSGPNIMAENYFSNVNLAREPAMSYVGNVRKKKRELLRAFVATKGGKSNTSVFGFNYKLTIVLAVPSSQKNIILLSTLHNDKAIGPGSGNIGKPEIITFYSLN
ncbi:unnamed protein product [Hermetia illucens]|uniref:PiggyBac transposable element-derived protein domain-containing protein n=1 Tax=Hermetia illucens TaxID=343691 RepID=A0A7R8URB8_HERIL|nr:unnamed protein product [Hermetia illucens]